MLPDDYADYRHDLVYEATLTEVGVYEAWWAANTRYPLWPLSKRLELAERVIQDIAANERAQFFRASWTDSTNKEPVPIDDLPQVLRAWDTWVLQADVPVVWFTIDEQPD